MSTERRVKFLRDDAGYQIINIPPGFELPGDSARISRDGDRLVIEPLEQRPSVAEETD
jgi:virulence-associated protein VagC